MRARLDEHRWLALFASIALLGPFAVSGVAQGCAGRSASAGWESIDPPFASGPQAIASYAVFPYDPDVLVVTNGQAVLSSVDGGCTFATLRLPEAMAMESVAGQPRITQVALAPSSAFRMYVAFADGLGRPHVLASTDAGSTWVRLDVGLEAAAGPPLRLVAGPAFVLYLLTDEGGPRAGEVGGRTGRELYYAVHSGDAAWELRQRFGAAAIDPVVANVPALTNIVVDPTNAQHLWLYGSGEPGLYSSSDGGRTLQRGPPAVPISALAVYARADAAWLTVFDASRPVAHVLEGAGASTIDLAEIGTSAAAGPLPEEFAFSTVDGRVFYQPPLPIEPVEISPTDGQDIDGITAAFARTRVTLYGRTATTLERRHPPPLSRWTAGGPDVPRPILVEDLPPRAALDRPTLLPQRVRVRLKPGQSKTVPYRLVLPGVRRVDAFFLVDISGSMDEEINGLRSALRRIVEDLVASDIDAYFGVGEFRSYREGPAYHRVRDIGPPGSALAAALNALVATGGGEETARAALYQIATGAGQRGWISPGQQANFRPGVLRVIVHGTDEAFPNDPAQPTVDEAAAALRGVSALQLGLSFEGPESPLETVEGPPTEDLKIMAVKTNALAAPPGVDCDGDGATDLPPGAPLVCVIPSQAAYGANVMAAAIVGLVESLEDFADVELRTADAVRVKTQVSPSLYRTVDFSLAQVLGFDVTFKCPRLKSANENVRLSAVARGASIAAATAVMVCGDISNQPPPPPPPVFPTAFVVPVTRIPDPAPNPQVNTQAQSQAQQQAQAQLQAALVPQEQEQPQFAYAYSHTEPNVQIARAQRGEEFAMVSQGDEPTPPPFVTLFAASAMAIAYAVATSVRNGAQAARASRRRSRRSSRRRS